MASITLPLLKSVAALATDKPLSDASLPSSPVPLGTPQLSATIDITDPAIPGANLGSFVISGSANTSVAIINSATDPDATGYFNLGTVSPQAAEDPANAPIIEPPVKFDSTLAYVVITGVSVTGKLSDSFSIGQASTLGLAGSGELDASTCTAFPRYAMAWSSISSAAANFRTIFSVDELLQPVPQGPALAFPRVLSFGVQRSLCLSLQVTAASMASALADSIGAVLNLSGPVNFTFGPSATIAISANATDGYRIFSQRAGSGTLFSIKKAKSTSRGLNVGAGLTIGIGDTALDDLVNAVFDQLAGVAVGTVQSILTPGSGPEMVLTPNQQQALQQVAGKLGLANTTGSDLQSLQAKLSAFKGDLTDRLRLNVAAQFSYSWQRLTSQSLLAQFTVPDAVLRKYHTGIISLDLTDLLAAPAADGVVFSRLLGQEVQETDIGYGFSFGVAGYTFLKSWDSLKDKFVELETYGTGGTTLRKCSFLGKREYDASWFNVSQQHYIELDASMASPVANPDASDFQAGLSIAFLWKNVGFQGVLKTVADFGAVVSAFSTDNVVAASQSLVDAGLPVGATGDALVSLTVPDLVLRQLLPVLAGPEYRARLAPYAMARALPFFEPYPERSRVEQRTLVYGNVFFNFLAADPENLPADAMAILCGTILRTQSLSAGLLAAESQQSFGWTAQGVVAAASQEDLQDAVLNQLPRSFSLLQQRTGDPQTVFTSCVSDFSGLAAQVYGSRVLAGMIVLAANLSPGWLDRLSRSVEFRWKDDQGSHGVISKLGSSK